jgi:hypothetical protein
MPGAVPVHLPFLRRLAVINSKERTMVFTRVLPLLVGTAWLTFASAAPTADDHPDGPPTPRVKPLATHTVAIEPFEKGYSRSPWGDGRLGGDDRRTYAFSPDGRFLVTQDSGGWQLEVWEVGTGKSLGRFGRVDNACVAFASDGKTVASAGSGPVDLWDVQRQKRLRNLDAEVNDVPFEAVAFAPDGRTIALLGVDGRRNRTPGIHLWDTADGTEIQRFALQLTVGELRERLGRPVFDCVCFAPDGKSVALVSDSRVLLYEVATGKERCVLGCLPPSTKRAEYGERSANGIACSPDGRLLAVACTDGLIRTWDIVTGKELLPAAHEAAVQTVVFSSDGKTLHSFGADNKARVWPAAELCRDWPTTQETLSRAALDKLWNNLGSEDVLVRHSAVRNLAAAGGQALPLLRERIKPIPAIDSQRVAQLVADLKKDDFNERKKVALELRALGELAAPAVREAINKAGHDEMLNRLLQHLAEDELTPEKVRAVQALTALEHMATDASRRLLGELVNGASEARLTREAKLILDRSPKETTPGTTATLDALWADLGSDHGRKAFQAVRALAARPKEAAPFLRDQLRPLAMAEAKDTPEHLARLTADLDADDFETREKASKELGKLGRRAEATLKKALEGSPSAEAKRRMEALLQEMGKPKLSAEQLQASRALEALERMGGDDAHAALESLVKDAKNGSLKDALADALKSQAK